MIVRIGLLFFLLSQLCYAETSMIALEKAPINIHDQSSIERGAKFFANTCMACHSMIYLRYDDLAKKMGVRYDRMPLNITKWPNDVKPPDLSLIASIRGADWIYTYLHSFYLDPTRPTGANNLVFPNTAMPYILSAFQGQQVRLSEQQLSKRFYGLNYQWYDLLDATTSGTLSPEEFDKTMADLVNFLVYAAAPYQSTQEKIGWWVIGFLVIFFILAYLLKREYWKDVQH